MINAITLPLVAPRHTAFVYSITIVGLDLTGGSVRSQVRLYFDQPGDPLISLIAAPAGSQGVSFTVDTSGLTPATTITLRIDSATMAALPAAAAIGDDLELKWDLLVTRLGLPECPFFRGPFTVQAGATF